MKIINYDTVITLGVLLWGLEVALEMIVYPNYLGSLDILTKPTILQLLFFTGSFFVACGSVWGLNIVRKEIQEK